MAQKNNLPSTLLRTLANNAVDVDKLLYFAPTDMTLDGELADGYVLLTPDAVVLALSGPDHEEIHCYKGVAADRKREKEYALRILPSDCLDGLAVMRNVCGGILHTVKKPPDLCQGEMMSHPETAEKESSDDVMAEEEQLMAFSNLYMGKVLHLCELFDKWKEHKKLSDEDLEEKEKEEYCPKCGAMYPDKNRKICPKCMDKRSIFFRTLKYFRPFLPKIAVMFVCYLATALLNLIWPYLNGTILYDKILSKNETFLKLFQLPAGKFATALLLVVLTMLLTRLVIQGLGILQGVFTAQIVPDVVKQMKNDVFQSMGKLSIGFYNSRQTGSLMTRVLSDADRVTSFFIDGLPYLFINVFTIIATLVVMFSMNSLLAVTTVVLMPLLFLISWRMTPVLWQYYGKRHRAERGLNAKINDNLTGARVVKAFGKQDHEMNRFYASNSKVKKAEMLIVGYDNRFGALYSIVENLASLFVWGIGAYLVLTTKQFEFGLLITFASYVSQLNGPLDFLSYVFRWWADSLNSAQRMYEIIDAVPEIVQIDHPVQLDHIRGEVELRDVTFGYEPNKPVLKHVNLKIEAGKMLGIVGRSGAGKSTLVNLISRLYDPTSGEILLDGVNLKDLAFDSLHGNVAMVSQETYIFIGSVADNISYANPNAKRKDILRAAILAGAHDFICKMPDGYDTMIGSGGRDLSGGERQRISIARAILADPKILILDEATSAVDTETEKAIQKSLNQLVKNRTTISIAHRLSTLRDADRLVVIDHGEITEEGTHAELVAKKGTYYKLKELQTKALAMRGMIE